MSRQGNDKDGMRPIGDIIKMSNLPKRIKRESRLMLAAGEIHDLTTLAARGESTTERRVGPDMAVPHAEVVGGDGRSR